MEMIEKAFLGNLIKADYLLQDTVIRPEHLGGVRHQELMKQMLVLKKSGKPVDLITLTTIPDLKMFGGMSYMRELYAHSDLEKFEQIEELILEAWAGREKQKILLTASKNDWSVTEIIDELDKLTEHRMNDHTSITQALERIYEAPWQERKETPIISTGIATLDELTGGFQEAEVTILAARPSMGKTDVMLQFAKEVGWAGYLPLVFSLEMPEKLITSRLIASTGGYSRIKMRNPYDMFTEKQKEYWPAVIGRLDQTYIQIFDESGQTMEAIRSKVRKMIHLYPERKPIIFIDYLTLIKPSHPYGGNPHQVVTEISRNLKMMAKDFNCPVVCLAQLNRSVETRANKRPLMSDIRESGSIEQDADVIIFLYREKYYEKESENPNIEMIVAKNRNGPTGVVEVKYNEYTGEIGR